MNIPDRVILHCSDTPDDSPKHQDIDAADIDRWHRKRNFRMIGYHYVIKRDGEIESGRLISDQGAHTYGQNVNSLGICYIGRYKPTKDQLDSLILIYDAIKKQYGISYSRWFVHNQYSKVKTCPGFGVELLRYLFMLHDKSKLNARRNKQ